MSAAFTIAFRAILCGALGLLVGNYYPFSGGPLVSLAEPFSPVRMEVGIGYAIVGSIAGVILLALADGTRKKES
jgi:hypothetical protein